ncbi:MAG: MBOAT family protein [Clostridia bacterium]|nr:MBOAT family protein [Clostridia bacterium]
MLFSSMIFLWMFLPFTVIVNALLNPRYSNAFLLFASLLFYAWGEPIYVVLMLFSIALNWLGGLLIGKVKRGKGICLALTVLLNLAILGVFKYYDFAAGSINHLVGSEVLKIKNIALPIGISFFTFQALSYVIDLYRGKCQVQKNFLNLALYISFFPQLIAGPIVRYSDIDRQIQLRRMTTEGFSVGFRRFIYGLSKKVMISNCMAQIADKVFALSAGELTTISAWIGAVSYMMQIYYDFSGYSDMAIGLGKMFGFDFLENFRYPYLARSIREFWQRWHISLGTWFREYVYIPLGGNRKGGLRTIVNLFIVFLLTGLWHGASWTFVVWGLYHGVFQIIERMGLGRLLKKAGILGNLYCLIVVLFGWVLFRADSISYALEFASHMVAPWKYGLENALFVRPVFLLNIRSVLVFIIAVLGAGPVQAITKKITPRMHEKWKMSLIEIPLMAAMLIYSIMLLASGTYNPFIYFRF